jgi:hypothetical protein
VDEARVLDWFDSLCDDDRRRPYSIAEIRAAMGIPATRLQIVLFRLGWRRTRANPFGIFLYLGPFHKWRRRELEDIDTIIQGSQS